MVGVVPSTVRNWMSYETPAVRLEIVPDVAVARSDCDPAGVQVPGHALTDANFHWYSYRVGVKPDTTVQVRSMDPFAEPGSASKFVGAGSCFGLIAVSGTVTLLPLGAIVRN